MIKCPKIFNYGSILLRNDDEIFCKPQIYYMGGVLQNPSSLVWTISIIKKKVPYKCNSCRTLFTKNKIASNWIDEMNWDKGQKLPTLNFLAFGTTYKKIQSRFSGVNWQFHRKSLENLVFEISCGGKELAGFQKPSFETPNIIPHPSPVLVFVDIFVKLKMASREPCELLTKNIRDNFDLFSSIDQLFATYKIQIWKSDQTFDVAYWLVLETSPYLWNSSPKSSFG